MSNFLPSQRDGEPCIIDIEQGVDCLGSPGIFEIRGGAGATFGTTILVVDTFKVANVLATDAHLVQNKLDQLCGTLSVSAEVKIVHGTGFNRVEMLKCILNAWVSNNGDKATISSLVEALKGMNLIAVSDSLSRLFGPATAVVFQSAPDAFTTPRVPMQNYYRETPAPQPNQFIFPPQPCQRYPGQENHNPDWTPRGEPMSDDAVETGFLKRFSSTTIHKICDNLFSQKVNMRWHNLPERGQDEQIVKEIVQAARIPGVADIVLKREEPKVGGWWNRGVASLSWNKNNHNTPKPLKVKMKVKKQTGKPLCRTLIKECIENTLVCKAFDVKVTDNIE